MPKGFIYLNSEIRNDPRTAKLTIDQYGILVAIATQANQQETPGTFPATRDFIDSIGFLLDESDEDIDGTLSILLANGVIVLSGNAYTFNAPDLIRFDELSEDEQTQG